MAPSRYGYPIARLVLQVTVLPGAQCTRVSATCFVPAFEEPEIEAQPTHEDWKQTHFFISTKYSMNCIRLMVLLLPYMRIEVIKAMNISIMSAGTATGLTTEESWFDSRQKQVGFHSSTPATRISNSPSLLSNGYWGAACPEVKRPEREADHSPPTSAEVKNVWSNTPTHPTRLHGVTCN
jgi:hypothetical protein